MEIRAETRRLSANGGQHENSFGYGKKVEAAESSQDRRRGFESELGSTPEALVVAEDHGPVREGRNARSANSPGE
jgi:hypothetical protein